MILQIIPIAEANVTTLMASVNKVIINPLIILLFALAAVYFIYGIVMYFLSPDNEEVRTKSKTHMLWGVIGMFIMVSVFGILSLIMNTLGVTGIDVNSKNITIDNNIK
jgi:predicted PurR-regulated permease PerM